MPSFVRAVLISLALFARVSTVSATVDAAATLTETAASGSSNTYVFVLNNTSTAGESLQTFWFAWIPGENFMATRPLTVQDPAGWSHSITTDGPGDGYAIEFTANSPSAALLPGNSLSGFGFTSQDTLATMQGNSAAHPGTPTTTSFVFTGVGFSGSSFSFVVPATAALDSSPFTATWTNAFGNGIWEQDYNFHGTADSGDDTVGNWDTKAYPDNGHFLTDPSTSDPVPGAAPLYNAVIGIAAPVTLGTAANVQSLTVAAGSTLNLSSSASLGIAVGMTNDGSINVDGTTAALHFDASAVLSGSGAVVLPAGTALEISGSEAVTTGSAQTLRGSGLLQIDPSASFNSNGILAPEPSGAPLSYSGALNPGSGSTLSIEIGGTGAYSVLNKSDAGPLTLNGTLGVRLINGFTPASTDIFTIVTTQSNLSGAFSNAAAGSDLFTADRTGIFTADYGAGAANPNAIVLSGFVSVSPLTGALGGSYSGLGIQSNGNALLQIQAANTGAFTAKLKVGNVTYAFAGKFTAGNTFDKTFTIAKKTVVVHLLAGQDVIVGVITVGGLVFHVEGNRTVFNAKTDAAPQAGAYTLLLLAGTDNADAPESSGYATLSVTAAGVVKFTGKLADGTAIAGSSALDKAGVFPLYVPLYASGTGGISGLVTFTDPSKVSAFGGSISWLKPPRKSGIGAGGFVASLDLNGFPYSPSAFGKRILEFQNVEGNAEFTTMHGGLGTPIDDIVTMNAANGIAPLVTGSDKLRLTVTRSTGVISGSFIPPGASKAVTLSGVVVQHLSIGSGFFLSGTKSGAFTLAANPAFGAGTPGGGTNGDKTSPVVTIKMPAANAKISGTNAVTFTGTASDRQGVQIVSYQVLHAGQISQPALATGTSNWTFTLSALSPGVYTVYVQALDVDGNNSAIVSRSFSVIP